MSRNDGSRFSKVPTVDIGRSRFDRSSTHKTTGNAGELIPIYVDEVLAGDTFTMDLSTLVRMSTPIFPTMDNAYLDTYFFYVPSRILWEHWKAFMGENIDGYWTPTTEYNIPSIDAPVGGFDKGSVADYMGVPTDVDLQGINALPFRAYAMIWSEWFRDQNTMPPVFIPMDDSTTEGAKRADATDFESIIVNGFRGGHPLPVAKFHDYFTSVLPEPQKGPDVDIPMFRDDIPVTSDAVSHGLSRSPVVFSGITPGFTLGTGSGGSWKNIQSTTELAEIGTNSGNTGAMPQNLFVDLTNIEYSSINTLRQAFQIQRLYEKDARGGTRFREILSAHFGVQSPDSRMQIPEYLGGKRIPINIDQVLQTSQTTESSPQGNTAAFSLTTDVSSVFTKSFTEPGYVIGVACVRTDHTYQQGLERMWSRQRRFDFYWPVFANLGEQAVLRKEILASGSESLDNEPFGYQEAWADYRYKPNRVSGAFRSNYAQSLDSWHYADYYESNLDLPFVINGEWLAETKNNIDRTLAVSSAVEDQFLFDFYFKCICTRPMPLYSVPGLIDHN